MIRKERKKRMPKQTFFNLPKEKKEVILNAARQEFSEVTLQEASIANIIKRAEIPRGSFYQYFEDKDDVFLYLVEEGSKDFFDRLIKALQDEKGNVFTACEIWFKQNIEGLEEPMTRKLCRNIFLSMNEKMQDRMTPHCVKHPFAGSMKVLVSNMDLKDLRISNEDEMKYFLKMLRGVIFGAMADYLKGNVEKEKCLKAYAFQMDIMKRGICKD